jgi:hypothetical protein
VLKREEFEKNGYQGLPGVTRTYQGLPANGSCSRGYGNAKDFLPQMARIDADSDDCGGQRGRVGSKSSFIDTSVRKGVGQILT